MTTITIPITLKDLKASETSISRAVKKAATQEKRLAQANAAIEAAKVAHAALIEQYGKQA